MLYAILAYHEEEAVAPVGADEDKALMSDLLAMNERLVAEGRLGPTARLGFTGDAVTLRGPGGGGMVIDGPFAESKEHLLGFYVVDTESLEAAVDIAREFRKANRSAVYEIRPVLLYQPGAPFPEMEA